MADTKDILRRAAKIRWHHHMIRGAIIAHVANGITTVQKSINPDTVIDAICLIFVITEYVISDREMTRKEREEGNADANNAAAVD